MKIVIGVFAFAVLLILGAQASYIRDTIAAIQENIATAIGNGIEDVQKKMTASKEKADELGQLLQSQAELLAQEVFDGIHAYVRSVDNHLGDMVAKADDADLEECKKISDSIGQTALAAVSRMSSCIVDKIELAGGYIETIIKLSDDVITDLNNLMEQSAQCGDGVDGITSGARAIVCANLVGARATWATATGIPSLTATINKLTYVINNLYSTLPHCTAKHGWAFLANECNHIVSDVEQCIKRKLAATTPKPPVLPPTTQAAPKTTPYSDTSSESPTL